MSNTNNLTAVFHKEIIPDSQILSSFCGKFIPTLLDTYYDIKSDIKLDQICVHYASKIKIYDVKSLHGSSISKTLAPGAKISRAALASVIAECTPFPTNRFFPSLFQNFFSLPDTIWSRIAIVS